MLGAKELPVRIFIRPNLNVLLEANTNAGDKLRQVAFDAAVKRRLGSTLYQERVADYQKLKRLSPDDFSFSEADMVKLFRGEHRELIRYIVDSARDAITRDQQNRLMDFVEWSGKGATKPLAYSTETRKVTTRRSRPAGPWLPAHQMCDTCGSSWMSTPWPRRAMSYAARPGRSVLAGASWPFPGRILPATLEESIRGQ